MENKTGTLVQNDTVSTVIWLYRDNTRVTNHNPNKWRKSKKVKRKRTNDKIMIKREISLKNKRQWINFYTKDVMGTSWFCQDKKCVKRFIKEFYLFPYLCPAYCPYGNFSLHYYFLSPKKKSVKAMYILYEHRYRAMGGLAKFFH